LQDELRFNPLDREFWPCHELPGLSRTRHLHRIILNHVTHKIVIRGSKRLLDAMAVVARDRRIDGQLELVDIANPLAAGADETCCVVDTGPAPFVATESATTGRHLGLGTVALSAEFRKRIATRLRVDPRDVHALVVGGEGDSAVPLWSSATAAGIPLHQWAVMGHGKMTVRDRIDIFLGVKEAFADAEFALAANVAACMDIADAVLGDANRVLPVATFVKGFRGIEGAWLALPCIVNAKGAEPPLDIAMNDAEIAGLRQLAV
jgi:malate/lactate dehydrogenase